MKRSTKVQIGRVTSTLGQAAVRNGAKGVDRAAAACFRAVFSEQTDPETTKAVLDQFQKIRARAEKRGPQPHQVGDKNARVKIKWTDEFIARVRREAHKFENGTAGNIMLARRLGLPDYCSDALRLGRRRFQLGVAATSKAQASPVIESTTADFSLAA